MVSDFGFAPLRYAAPPATRLGDTARERGIRTNWAARNLALANGSNGSKPVIRTANQLSAGGSQFLSQHAAQRGL